MITENLSTLKIHKLTQAQYDRELEAGTIDANALYLTPDEEIDLSPYATVEQLNTKADAEHEHSIEDITNLQSSLDEKVSSSRTINGKALTSNVSLSASDVGAANTDHTHDDMYYTESEIDSKLSGKADLVHSHDDLYYTETEIDEKLADKAPKSYIINGTLDASNNVTLTNFNWDETLSMINSTEHIYIALRTTDSSGDINEFVFTDYSEDSEYIYFRHLHGSFIETIVVDCDGLALFNNNKNIFVTVISNQVLSSGSQANARANIGLTTETWTFTLEDGSTVTKAVYVG